MLLSYLFVSWGLGAVVCGVVPLSPPQTHCPLGHGLMAVMGLQVQNSIFISHSVYHNLMWVTLFCSMQTMLLMTRWHNYLFIAIKNCNYSNISAWYVKPSSDCIYKVHTKESCRSVCVTHINWYNELSIFTVFLIHVMFKNCTLKLHNCVLMALLHICSSLFYRCKSTGNILRRHHTCEVWWIPTFYIL